MHVASAAAHPLNLLQLILDLVEAGLDAGLVLLAARRAGGAGRADHIVADLDRQRALRRGEAGQRDCRLICGSSFRRFSISPDALRKVRAVKAFR